MTAEEYINKRVDQFQGWYDAKAVKAKTAFLRVRTTAVIGSALVPVAANITIPSVGWIRHSKQRTHHGDKPDRRRGGCSG